MRKVDLMAKVLAALVAVFVLWAAPAMAQTAGTNCNQSVVFDTNTTGSTKLVTGSASSRIFVCGFDFFAGGTVNVKLVSGTGGTCGSNTVALTPAFQFTQQTGLVDPAPYWRGLTPVPASNDLCINLSGTVAVQAIVYYMTQP